MYTLIFKVGGQWELSNYTAMSTDYLVKLAGCHVIQSGWEDWRIERYDTDFQWHEIGGLVVDANRGDEQAMAILGID